MIVNSMKELHKAVAERDDYICQFCFKDFKWPMYFENDVNVYVCAHHVLSRGSHPEKKYDTDVCVLTCKLCHIKAHS